VRTEFAVKMLTNNCGTDNPQNKVCEVKEMMKLYGVSLIDYHRVVMCDGDLLFLDNIDELLGRDEKLMQATYDHELDFLDTAGFTNSVSDIPLVNGGFVVVKPTLTDFEALVELVKEGDFHDGSGWEGKRVGWGYGGIGPQGLFAYYYNKDALEAGEVMVKAPDMAKNMTISPTSSRVQVLDRSVYDVIVTDDLLEALQAQTVLSKNVKVFHFTGKCQKPWTCGETKTPICTEMTERWWQMQVEFAARHGSPAPPRCKVGDVGSYSPMSPSMLIQIN